MSAQEVSHQMRWETAYRKRDDVVTREIAGETMLIPIRGKLVDMQRIFSLNPVAAHIWQQLDGTKNVAEALGDVLEAFSVDEAQAKSDIEEFVGDLLEAGLIVEGI